jgi:hypothetical protein
MRVRVFTPATKSPEDPHVAGVVMAPANFSRDMRVSGVLEGTMTTSTLWKMRSSSILVVPLLIAACGGGVSSNEDAMKAYLGLDPSVDKAITLGFAGFNSASSANISPQSADGGVSGTMTVTGQVDQGASANKGMRLLDALSNYSDDGKISYSTDSNALPALTINLKNIPNGTLDGSLNGSFAMSGGLSGPVSLALTFTGQIAAGPNNTVVRQTGTTHVIGTATSSAGTYNVDVTR